VKLISLWSSIRYILIMWIERRPVAVQSAKRREMHGKVSSFKPNIAALFLAAAPIGHGAVSVWSESRTGGQTQSDHVRR
jgi:hypothetical protein